jgi:hypothetical protein
MSVVERGISSMGKSKKLGDEFRGDPDRSVLSLLFLTMKAGHQRRTEDHSDKDQCDKQIVHGANSGEKDTK